MAGTENEFTLVECMKEVPDPRAPYNQRHRFLDIIVIAVTAILCGMDAWNEMEYWAKSKKEWLGTAWNIPGTARGDPIPRHDKQGIPNDRP